MSKFLDLVSKYNNILNEQDQVADTSEATPEQTQQAAGEPAQMTQVEGAPDSEMPNAAPESDDTPILNMLRNLDKIFKYAGPEISKIKTENLLKNVTDQNLESTIEQLVTIINAKAEQKQTEKAENPMRDENQPKDPADIA